MVWGTLDAIWDPDGFALNIELSAPNAEFQVISSAVGVGVPLLGGFGYLFLASALLGSGLVLTWRRSM
jgi:hypothetical protein